MTKLHLLLLLLVLAAGGAGYWYWKDKQTSAPEATLASPTPSPPPQEQMPGLTPEPSPGPDKNFQAAQAIAVAGEYMKIGRKEFKDMTGPESTLRQAKELLASGDYEGAYRLAHQAIDEFGQAPLSERTYTVRRGDTLWHIAKRSEHYGRGSKWVKIWRANEAQIPDFDLIEVGQKIKIPASPS